MQDCLSLKTVYEEFYLSYFHNWFIWEKVFTFIVAERDLKDCPINNAENHNESQGAEKSENIHFLAHFINIPIVFMSAGFDINRINACNLNSFAWILRSVVLFDCKNDPIFNYCQKQGCLNSRNPYFNVTEPPIHWTFYWGICVRSNQIQCN